MKKLTTILLIFCSVLVFSSCEKFLDKAPDNLLTAEDNYTDRSNVYATFAGIFSALQDCADSYIFLAELRGDLLMPTGNAPDEIWEVYNYEQDQTNSFVNPAPFYKIVMNCNDFLRNIVKYNKDYPGVLEQDYYRQMISAAVTMRAWAYLTIGKFYGGAVYYDYSMTGEVNLAELPWLSFDELIPELIYFMNNGVDRMNAFARVNVDQILFGSVDKPWRRIAMNADMVMAELCLWYKDYENAAKRAINLIKGIGSVDVSDDPDLNAFTMNRYKAANYMNMWDYGNNNRHDEGMTMVYYQNNQRQTNRLQEYFSADGTNLYYLTYSDAAYYAYLEIIEEGGVTWTYMDPRLSHFFRTETGNSPTIYKYTHGRSATDRDASIYIYRAAEAWLMIAEALSGLGNFDAADALINDGMIPSYVAEAEFSYPFDAPIYSSQRFSVVPGVRGRVEAYSFTSTDERFMPEERYEEGTEAYTKRRKFVVDSLIAAETGRELCYEGKRWFTLMRIARNTDNPDFLATIVPLKYRELNGYLDREKYDRAYAYLSNPDNWFVKYDFKLEK